jgi:capsular polysaccharide biosynthesis protein
MSRLAKVFNKLSAPRLCEDVAAWDAMQGNEFQEIHRPIDAEASEAAKLDPRISRQFELRKHDLQKPQTLHRIQNAKILGPHGVVVLPDGRFVLQGQWDRSFLEADPIYHHFSRIGSQQIAGDVYCLMSRWGDSYYHWFHDVLPRLFTALPHLPKETRFLLNENPSDYQIESLQAFGIHRNKIHSSLGPFARIRAERLWFATPLGNPEFSSGDVIRKTGSLIRDAGLSSGSRAHGSDRIFVSRKKCGRRRLINEDAAFVELERFGFRRIFFEEMSFREQVRYAAHAKVICGLHGAGFTNMIFSESRQKIIEIMSPRKDQIHYKLLASKLGHLHRQYDSVEEIESCNESDYKLEPNSFSKFIQQCLEAD